VAAPGLIAGARGGGGGPLRTTRTLGRAGKQTIKQELSGATSTGPRTYPRGPGGRSERAKTNHWWPLGLPAAGSPAFLRGRGARPPASRAKEPANRGLSRPPLSLIAAEATGVGGWFFRLSCDASP